MEWDAQTSPRSLLAATPHSQIVWHAPLPTVSDATLLLLAGDDPWFELPIAPGTLAACPPEGMVLDIQLGWPMSGCTALSGSGAALHDRIAQLETCTNDIQGHLNQVQTTLASAQSRNALLEESNQAATRQRAAWQLEATRLQHDYDELAQHLKNIESSTVFRATRPLVHAKMRIDRLLGRAPATAPPSQCPRPFRHPNHPVDIIVPVYRAWPTPACPSTRCSPPPARALPPN